MRKTSKITGKNCANWGGALFPFIELNCDKSIKKLKRALIFFTC